MVPLSAYLILSALMFVIGAVGFIFRRNTIVMLMCLELMLNAVNISFAAFSRFHGNIDGQVAAFFVIVAAAAEAALGLALIISLYRAVKSLDSYGPDELRP
ncbi:MAG: NADH-quinone oxidoreductase subunit NuoK [Deltaproteobacteria bacterium]|nr:NADH-quinone oxidoreductase subunit NuoK [Deltaproteobacteria bacterium]